MLLRIALAIAILAGIAAAVLNVVKVKERVTTIIGERNAAQTELASTKQTLTTTQTTLTKTKDNLDSTTKNLATATSEASRAKTEAADQTKRANDLKTQLDKTTAERTDAQRLLAAWSALGLSVDQIKGVVVDLKQARTDLATLTNQVKSIKSDLAMKENQLMKILDQNFQVAEPNVTAKVLAVDPKFDFVVLDVGQDKGMLPDGDMIVSRDAKPVATVRIRTVDERTCIANVRPLPGGSRFEVFEGDLAFPDFRNHEVAFGSQELKDSAFSLLGFILFAASGCATTSDESDSERPWNAPKGWENGVPGSMNRPH